MPLSWPGAFKKAVVYVVWLIIWGLVAATLIAAGAYLAGNSLTNLVSALMSGMPPVFDSSLLMGLGLAVIGYILLILGSIASFIRLVYDLTRQASLEVWEGKQRAVATPRAPPPPTAVPQAKPPEISVEPVKPPQPAPPVEAQQTFQPPPTQVKYCAFCGKLIPMGARFCPFCQRAQP